MDMRMAFILGFTLGGVLNFYQFKTFVTDVRFLCLFTSGVFTGSVLTMLWQMLLHG